MEWFKENIKWLSTYVLIATIAYGGFMFLHNLKALVISNRVFVLTLLVQRFEERYETFDPQKMDIYDRAKYKKYSRLLTHYEDMMEPDLK